MAGENCQLGIRACEGWSTKQELAFYDKFLQGVNWRAIVLVFCMNDLLNEWKCGSNEGVQLGEEVAETGGLAVTNQLAAGLQLAALLPNFARDAATARLRNRTTRRFGRGREASGNGNARRRVK